MKTRVLSCSLAALFLIALTIVPGSCKKDEDSKTFWRIITMNNYIDNVQTYADHLEYTGEKYTDSRAFDYESGDSVKSTITYPDENSAIILDYSKIGGQWEPMSKGEYTFQNQLATQLIFYESSEGTFVPFMKINLTYQSGNMVEETWSFYVETWQPTMKIEYTYDGDNVVQSILSGNFSGSWEIANKEVVTYSGDKVDVIIESDYDGQAYSESSKYEFIYTDNILSKVQTYSFESGSWQTDSFIDYTYDQHGNLTSETGNFADEVDKYVYSYEEGKGNFGQISFFYYLGGVANQFIPKITKSTRIAEISEFGKSLREKTD